MGVDMHKPNGDMKNLCDISYVSLSSAARLLSRFLVTVAAAVATLQSIYGDDESSSHTPGSLTFSAHAFFWSHIIAIHFVSAYIEKAGHGLGIIQAVHLLIVGACCQAWTNWAFLSTCIFTMSSILGFTFGDGTVEGDAQLVSAAPVMTTTTSPSSDRYDSVRHVPGHVTARLRLLSDQPLHLIRSRALPLSGRFH